MATRYVDVRESSKADYSSGMGAEQACDGFGAVLDILSQRCHAISGLVYVNNLLTRQISIVAAAGIDPDDRNTLIEDAQRNLEEDTGLQRRASDLTPAQFLFRDKNGVARMVLAVPLSRGHEITSSAVLIFGNALLDQGRHIEPARELQPLLKIHAEIWLRLQREIRLNAALAASLDVSSVGIFLIDANRSVLYRNATALALIEERDGLLLANGRPTAPRLADSLKMTEALEHVLDLQMGLIETTDDSSPAIMLPRENGAPLFCIIMGLDQPRQESADPLLLMIVVRPESDIANLIRPICDVYGLSVVERELAIGLVEGLSIADAATSMNVQKETARGYLKQIFLKTDTHRQAELVHFFMRYVMRISDRVTPESCF